MVTTLPMVMAMVKSTITHCCGRQQQKIRYLLEPLKITVRQEVVLQIMPMEWRISQVEDRPRMAELNQTLSHLELIFIQQNQDFPDLPRHHVAGALTVPRLNIATWVAPVWQPQLLLEQQPYCWNI